VLSAFHQGKGDLRESRAQDEAEFFPCSWGHDDHGAFEKTQRLEPLESPN